MEHRIHATRTAKPSAPIPPEPISAKNKCNPQPRTGKANEKKPTGATPNASAHQTSGMTNFNRQNRLYQPQKKPVQRRYAEQPSNRNNPNPAKLSARSTQPSATQSTRSTQPSHQPVPHNPTRPNQTKSEQRQNSWPKQQRDSAERSKGQHPMHPRNNLPKAAQPAQRQKMQQPVQLKPPTDPCTRSLNQSP